MAFFTFNNGKEQWVCLHTVYSGTILFLIYKTIKVFIAYTILKIVYVFSPLEYIVTFPCTDNLGGFVTIVSNFYDY